MTQKNRIREDSVVWTRYNGCKKSFEKININHEILYYQKKFKAEVIDFFIDSWHQGKPQYLAYKVIRQLSLEIFLNTRKI